MRYGAHPEDWARFDLVYGLTEDLLPVVSNLGAERSTHSTLKGLGKTPSLYNGHGKAVGIREWTRRVTDGAEVETWAKQPDYGICVQTRQLRALDIDVTQPELAKRIAKAAEAAVGRELPVRYRASSSKCLLAFRYSGELFKRVVPVRAWTEPGEEKVRRDIVELLATGQQFIAAGTHTSGDRYLWDMGLEDEFPEINAEQLEALWAAVKTFAIGDEHVASKRQRGEKIETQDDVALWLVEHAETYGYSRDGDRLYVPCPWASGHSTDSGETEAAWLLAGTNGLQRGHFKCLHASCAGRTDEQFLDEVGYRDADFEVITDDIAALYEAQGGKLPARNGGDKGAISHLPLPGFKRDNQGRIEPVLPNVVKALQHVEACGLLIGFDEFRAELSVREPGGSWRPLKDADAVTLRMELEGVGFKPVGKEMMRDALVKVAEINRFDSAKDWLDGLVWDGTPRVERLMARYFGCEDSAYARAVGLYAMTAHAGRVLDPGCQADMAVVLVGAQGLRKSSGIMALAPAPAQFAILNFNDDDADQARKMRGKVVAEIAELRGLEGRDAESIKEWITRRSEEWTPKFMEFQTTFGRRLIMWGSTNKVVDGFLADDTGERRWLPATVGCAVDVEALTADRDQLWAEGAALWRQAGVAWAQAERLARGEHAQFKKHDVWEPLVATWLDDAGLDDVKNCDQPFTALDVLVGALRLDAKHVGRREEMRVAGVLRALGYEVRVVKVGGKSARRWHSTT